MQYGDLFAGSDVEACFSEDDPAKGLYGLAIEAGLYDQAPGWCQEYLEQLREHAE